MRTEVTYAVDKKKKIMPILQSETEWQDVCQHPSKYTQQNKDIEFVVPKMEAIFNMCNRIPHTGAFESDFDRNMEALISVLQSVIVNKEHCSKRSSGMRGSINNIPHLVSLLHSSDIDTVRDAVSGDQPKSLSSNPDRT